MCVLEWFLRPRRCELRRRFFVLPKSLAAAGVEVFRRGGLFMVIRRPRWGFTEWCGCFYLREQWHPRLYDSFLDGVRSVLKKSAARTVEGECQAEPEGGDFLLMYPTLWTHLVQAKWDDGSPRKPSSITIFSDGPVMKCVLKDKETSTCLWLACPSMDGLFVLVEAALNDPATVWRLDRNDSGGRSTRVKPPR